MRDEIRLLLLLAAEEKGLVCDLRDIVRFVPVHGLRKRRLPALETNSALATR